MTPTPLGLAKPTYYMPYLIALQPVSPLHSNCKKKRIYPETSQELPRNCPETSQKPHRNYPGKRSPKQSLYNLIFPSSILCLHSLLTLELSLVLLNIGRDISTDKYPIYRGSTTTTASYRLRTLLRAATSSVLTLGRHGPLLLHSWIHPLRGRNPCYSTWTPC